MTTPRQSNQTVAISTAPDPSQSAGTARKQHVLLNLIRMDGGTQIRVALDSQLIEDYYEDMLRGDEFPPVILFFDGKNYWLADGFYRTHARMKNPLWTTIAAEIREGKLRDAILYAIGANATHGRPRTHEEKRLAVRRLLEDEEWKKLADNLLCKIAKVTQPFVSSQRRILSKNSASAQPEVRIGADGKERNTANIGRRKKEEPLLLDMSEMEETDITPLDTDFHVAQPSESQTSREDPSSTLDHGQSNLFDSTKTITTPKPSPLKTTSPPIRSQRASTTTQPDTDPEGWAELRLRINVTINPGKSQRRRIMVSGQAGDSNPIFMNQFTLADLEPLPAPITELVATLKRAYARKIARTSTKSAKHSRKKPSKKR